jgi:hypothetical protein
MAPKKKKGIGPGVQVWVKDKAIYGTDLYGKAEVRAGRRRDLRRGLTPAELDRVQAQIDELSSA